MVALRRRAIGSLVFVLACSCGEAEEVDPSPPRVSKAPAGPPSPSADPLLARAREHLHGGRIPEDIVQALLASDAPEHRRARRLLQAMRGEDELEDDGEAAAEPVPLVPPKIPTDPSSDVAPVPQDKGEATAPPTETASTPPRSTVKSRGARGSLSGISLREHAKGATLTLQATGGVVVGMTNQPRSGIVRLVVESSGAAAKVLTARPRITGARVTEVRAGTGTVIVTLALDPGWSLGSIERTSKGARIHLRRPA